jgi:hypothetical protein
MGQPLHCLALCHPPHRSVPLSPTPLPPALPGRCPPPPLPQAVGVGSHCHVALAGPDPLTSPSLHAEPAPTPSPFFFCLDVQSCRAPVLPFVRAERPWPSLGSNRVAKPPIPFCLCHSRPRPLLRAIIHRDGATTHHTSVRTTSKRRFPVLFVAANSSPTPLSPRA